MKRKKRVKLILVIVLLTIIILFVFLNYSLSPLIKELATAAVSNKASAVVNRAIEAQMEEGSIHYDRIVFLEKDINGNITALKTNIAEINRLRTQTLSAVDKLLMDLEISEIGLPLGNLILPEFFSGAGPILPVRIVSVSSSEAQFHNVFYEAGINQTAHQIMLEVSVNMTVLTPTGTLNVEANSSVVVAETVIVGNVPGSYVSLD